MFKRVAAGITVLAVTAGLMTAGPAAAYDDVQYVDDCVMTLPKKIYLHANKAVNVNARIRSCPFEVEYWGYATWDWENLDTNSYGFSFTHDSDALYPSSGMTTKLYSWDAGTYMIRWGQEGSSFSPSYYTEYKFGLDSNPSMITAKLRSSVSINVRGKGRNRVLTATARRHTPYTGIKRATGRVSIYRNNKKWKTLKLKKGSATVRLPGRKKARWHAAIGGTQVQWGASSYATRR